MSTRGQVYFPEEGVYLYQHFDAYELPKTVQRALARSRDRWDDVEYLTRVVFSEMLGFVAWYYENKGKLEADVNKEMRDALFIDTTGLGIGTTKHTDIDYLITVDTENRTVQINRRAAQTFEDFVSTELPNFEEEEND